LRRFSSAKKFFAFTLRALTKRSSPALYLDARDLKSACSVHNTGKNFPAEGLGAFLAAFCVTSEITEFVVVAVFRYPAHYKMLARKRTREMQNK
jgi:hypothetical protein